MENKKEMFFGICVILSLFVISGILLYVDYQEEKREYPEKTQEENVFEKVERIAKEVSLSREYELGVYDCTNFSRQLVERFDEEDILANCVNGYFYEIEVYSDKDIVYRTLKIPTRHTWVAVKPLYMKTFYIESLSGKIIDNKTFEENYDIRGGGCV